jgi:hypothetical protein
MNIVVERSRSGTLNGLAGVLGLIWGTSRRPATAPRVLVER